jgi:GDPmannose 4,6-dehydratase
MSEKKRAFITGINGMDGSHLADLLLSKDYEVFGLERRTSIPSRQNTKHIEDQITFITGDMTDKASLERALKISNPHEVYNLAAQSFVGSSWNLAEQTTKVNSLGPLYLLESILSYNASIRFYQASTSEMFGRVVEVPQAENTPFYPRSPYAVSKLYAHWITKNFRESYKIYACNGILFNHESERRGIEFVTRKITDGVARIHLGLQDKISLGNLDSKRDWGYAPDYVEAMWLMMQQDQEYFFSNKVGDFVIATGKNYSIRDFLSLAFSEIGISDWQGYIVQDPTFMRPAEVDTLMGDPTLGSPMGNPTKAKEVLGWEPKTSLQEIVRKMVKNDIEMLKQ